MGCASSKESREGTPNSKSSGSNGRPQSAGKKRASSGQASKQKDNDTSSKQTAGSKQSEASQSQAGSTTTVPQSSVGSVTTATAAKTANGPTDEVTSDTAGSQPSQSIGPLPAVLQPGVQPAGPMVLEVPGQEPPLWLRFSYLTQRGYYPEAPGKANQDSFFVVPQLGGYPNLHLFGVFDGHGDQGTPCSQFSRDRLAYNLVKHEALITDPARAFFDAFVLTNDELHRSPIDDSMSGSTGIVVLMNGRKLYAANVGDSRAVLAEWQPAGSHAEGPAENGLGGEGEIEKAADNSATVGGKKLAAVDMSSDQTPFRDDESARVRATGARVLTLDQLEGVKDPNVQCWGQEGDDDGDPPRLWVPNGMYPGTAFTRSLGDSVAERIGVYAEPEVKEMEIDERHPFFVVASDGVFEFMSSQDVVDMVAHHNEPHAACQEVVSESYRLWLQYETRTDDITIIAVHLDTEPHSPAEDGLPPSGLSMRSAPSSHLSHHSLFLPTTSMLSDMPNTIQRRLIDGTDIDRLAAPLHWVPPPHPAAGSSSGRQEKDARAGEEGAEVEKGEDERAKYIAAVREAGGEVGGEGGEGSIDTAAATQADSAAATAATSALTTGAGADGAAGGEDSAVESAAESGAGESEASSLPAVVPVVAGPVDILKVALQGNFLFQSLSPEQHSMALQCFEYHVVKPGDIVIQQGDLGDRFYVCHRGEFDVLVLTDQPEEDPLGSLVHRYMAHDNSTPSFGDLALLYGTRREASVRAASQGRLWALPRPLFHLVRTSGLLSGLGEGMGPRPSLLRVLRSLPFLGPLTFSQLQALAGVMTEHRLGDGEEMDLHEDTFYVVEQGEVKVAGTAGADTAATTTTTGTSAAADAAAGSPAGRASSHGASHSKRSAESDLPPSVRALVSEGSSSRKRDGGKEGVGSKSRRREWFEAERGHRPEGQFFHEEVLLVAEGGTEVEGEKKEDGEKKEVRVVASRVTAVGEAVLWSVDKKRCSDAVGSLADAEAVDQRLRTFQAILRLNRSRSENAALLSTISPNEVEWGDVLTSNEWSEVAVAKIRLIGKPLAFRRYGKLRVAAACRSKVVLREKELLTNLLANPFVPSVLTRYDDTTSVALLLNAQLAVPLAVVMSDPMTEDCARFVAGSVVLALQLLHRESIVLRGVNPSTIFFDVRGQLQIADLRFAKRLTDGRTFTMCGAPDYMAPEIIAGHGHGQPADWWALGALIFTLIVGDCPFGSWKDSELQVYTRIARRDFAMPEDISPEAADIIEKLMAPNPEDRLGCGPGGAEAVKAHPWFAALDWKQLASLQLSTPPDLVKRIDVAQKLRMSQVEERGVPSEVSYAQEQLDAIDITNEAGGNLDTSWFEGW